MKIKIKICICLLLSLTSLCMAAPAVAEDKPLPFISDIVGRGPVGGGNFAEKDGACLYEAICQACHMPGGIGAVGAGMYPALANNAKLAASGYIVYNVVHGRHGMPGFGRTLSDAQVAAVVNYVRSNFGNHFSDAVTPADAAKVR